MNRKFEIRIAGMMLVALALVSVTGIYAYRQFSQVVTELGKDALPDLRLSTTKSVLNGLSDAENSVKSYNLTQDSVYIAQFSTAVNETEVDFNRLTDLSNGDKFLESELSEIDTLIAQKINVLNRWLELNDPYRADVALTKAMLSLEVNPGQEKTKVSAEDISKAVQKVKKEEALVERIMREREMKIIAKSNAISEEIRDRFSALEEHELERLSAKTDNAEKAVRNTNLQMALFFVALGLLLFAMAFVILTYVKNNNRYRKALRHAKNEAEEMAKSRERFLANMSHEIRTPMNAIAGFTEQLASSKLNADQQEQLAMVQKSTDHLLHVINEILDLTKLQSDKLQLESVGFQLRETLNEAVSIMQPLAAQKELKLSVSIDENTPEILVGDAYRLRQMVLNLLGNAVKFTENGTISIEAKPARKGVEISVSDTGIGMTEDQVGKVFQEFEQGETSTTKNYGGTGLGLSIVHRLVKLHNGEIDVKSEPGKGSIFTLSIPYQTGSEADLPKSESSLVLANENLQNLNVLIVDDEPFNRKLLSTILSKHQATFKEASNGKEAVEMMASSDFDLILMDARMPEMNGLEATKAIRKLKNDTPIIILSAAVTTEDRKQYEAAKTNDFLAKPFKENELLLTITNVLQTKNSAIAKATDKTVEKTTELDYSELMEMSGNDESFFLEMLETFYYGTKKGLQDIREALQAKDALQVAEHAHRISSPCKHVSAIELYQNLKKLEEEGRGNADIEQLEKRFKKIESEAKTVLNQVEKRLKL